MIASIEGRLTEEYLAHIKEAVNAEQNPVEYLGIDPGKANGICGYDAKYYLSFMLTIQADDMIMFLQQFQKIKKCVIEGYKVFPNKSKQHIYSDLETPRVIGRVESWAEINEVELIKQPSSIKPTAYAWLGVKPPSKKDPKNHMMDGHAHFMYWAVRTRRVDARDLVKRMIR